MCLNGTYTQDEYKQGMMRKKVREVKMMLAAEIEPICLCKAVAM